MIAAVVGIIAGINLLAYLRARSLTRFLPSGARTPRPEDLPPFERLKVMVFGARIPRSRNDRTPADVGLTFSSFNIKGPVGRIACWRIPRRRAAGRSILFHGYAGMRSHLLDNALVQWRAGQEVFIAEFRASGGSAGRDTSIGWHEAEDVMAVVRALDPPDGRSSVVFGVSMGAASVLRAVAHLGLRPRAVILESPFDTLVRTTGNRFRAMGLPGWPLADLLVFWGGVRLGFPGWRHRPVDWARSVICPALVLARGSDTRARVPEVRAVFRNLGGPKRFAILPGAGHEDMTPRAQAVWNQEVAAFLRTHRRRG